MRLVLISENRDLWTFVRELVQEFASDSPDVSMVSASAPRPRGDLYIWDYQPAMKLPRDLASHSRKHLFLVDRKELATFSEAAPAEASIVLKPPTRGSMGAFLAGIGNSGAQTLRGERDDMLQGLIQANLRLQEYDQDRTNFLARAVHDFRAPLTAISGYCGLLLEQQLGSLDADQREVLERMQHSAKRLSRMASAMFQLSVGRHLEQTPNLQRGDIRDCIDQALHEVAPFSQDKQIEITIDFNPPEESLYFERAQIEQVLINLLDNACKFTPRNGTIEVRGYPFFWERRVAKLSGYAGDRRMSDVPGPNAFRIDICDTGPGIPASHMRRIFEEYTYYGGARDRSGGGLGLAICRMILHNHGGRVWAESSDAGAVFSFVLPYYRPELPRDPARFEVDSYHAVQQRR